MIFHSLDFVVFFVAIVAIYWRLPHRGQNILLLAGSYVFYGYVHPWFLLLIFASTVADYWAGIGMAAQPERKRLWLGLSLAVNLGMLGFFKYFNFFAENVQGVLALVHLDVSMPALRVMLPVGISFYTFQELTYTLGVYRGTIQARRDFIDFAAFVCFFPQLVAGPIERADRLLPQMERPRQFSWTASRDAAFLIVWGYFQKLVIADNVGTIANKVFALREPGFFVLWAGVFAFAIQIYADFSAYSDIARGTARWLGFDLMRNFNHPYFARGPADFWRRWHISLSSWFRDYVYIPLGGSRVSLLAQSGNILITFLLSGLWHGASWNYVLWGAYHGVLLVIARLGQPWAPASPAARAAAAPFQIAGTFLLVGIGWLMFRETDTAQLLRDLTLSPAGATAFDRAAGAYLCLLTLLYSLPLWAAGVWELYVAPRIRRARAPAEAIWWTPVVTRAALTGVLFAIILVFRSRQSLDFIYFRF